jgi:hypothetical protein
MSGVLAIRIEATSAPLTIERLDFRISDERNPLDGSASLEAEDPIKFWIGGAHVVSDDGARLPLHYLPAGIVVTTTDLLVCLADPPIEIPQGSNVDLWVLLTVEKDARISVVLEGVDDVHATVPGGQPAVLDGGRIEGGPVWFIVSSDRGMSTHKGDFYRCAVSSTSRDFGVLVLLLLTVAAAAAKRNLRVRRTAG